MLECHISNPWVWKQNVYYIFNCFLTMSEKVVMNSSKLIIVKMFTLFFWGFFSLPQKGLIDIFRGRNNY